MSGKRAPDSLAHRIRTIPGVDIVEPRIVFRSNNYEIRDNTGVTVGARGLTLNPSCEPLGLSAGGPCLGNIAETFEFRAIDRNLRTPYIQQWSMGYQWEFASDFLWEVRYNGAKGTDLLLATPLAQPSHPGGFAGCFMPERS